MASCAPGWAGAKDSGAPRVPRPWAERISLSGARVRSCMCARACHIGRARKEEVDAARQTCFSLLAFFSGGAVEATGAETRSIFLSSA